MSAPSGTSWWFTCAEEAPEGEGQIAPDELTATGRHARTVLPRGPPTTRRIQPAQSVVQARDLGEMTYYRLFMGGRETPVLPTRVCARQGGQRRAVSYTHLTLPTKRIV